MLDIEHNPKEDIVITLNDDFLKIFENGSQAIERPIKTFEIKREIHHGDKSDVNGKTDKKVALGLLIQTRKAIFLVEISKLQEI